MKVCNKCGVSKPSKDYYTQYTKKGTVGLRAVCKECHRTKQNEHQKAARRDAARLRELLASAE